VEYLIIRRKKTVSESEYFVVMCGIIILLMSCKIIKLAKKIVAEYVFAYVFKVIFENLYFTR